MGLETAHILSDERHHGPFICAICQNLCGLDALVTTGCSHVFCRLCLETWLSRRMEPGTSFPFSVQESRRTCPTCNRDLAYGSNTNGNGREKRCRGESMMIGGQCVDAQPLSEYQPLAHRLLRRVKVSCPLREDHGCPWIGDYADLQEHLVSVTAHSSTSMSSRVTATSTATEPLTGKVAESNKNEKGGDKKCCHARRSINIGGVEKKSTYLSRENSVADVVAGDPAKKTSPMNGQNKPTEENEHQNMRRKQKIRLAKSFKDEANGRYATENYKEAKDLYTKALAILIDDGDQQGDATAEKMNEKNELLATLYANRAACHRRLRNFASCVDDSSTAIKIDKHYIKAYVRRASALVELGKFDEACQSLEEGLKENPNSPPLTKELVSSSSLRDDMRKGIDELQADQFALAKSTFGALLRMTACNVVILAAARADLGLGLTDSALRLSLNVIRSDRCNAEGYEVRGQCMYLMGDFDKSMAVLKEAITLDPDSASAKTSLRQCRKVGTEMKEARQAAFQRRFNDAVDHFTTALGEAEPLPPKSPIYCMIHSERAEAFLRLKQFDLALKDCSLVLYAREDFQSAWLVKAKSLLGLGRHEEARDEMSDLLNKWGSGNEKIRDLYNRADFEVRKKNRPDFYALFGVPSIASEMEIKKQYKAKALELHPDRFSGAQYSGSQRKDAEEKFKLLGEGLEILTDDFKRLLYDEGYDQAAIKDRVAAAQQAAHRRSRGQSGYHGRHGS